MTSDKKNISLLADLAIKSGISNIVISPGSRNAPIILSFANRSEVKAFSIIDERSAAFFALGLALKTGKPVAIACTSGSAVLNYASAISEAYYQHVPLLIITADRPEMLVDIGDGQTIRQKDVFSNFIKSSYQLPESIDAKEQFKNTEEIINEALNSCLYPEPGPVHINIPFAEPIYGTTDEIVSGKFSNNLDLPKLTDTSTINNIIEAFNTSKKVMIIVGQNRPDEELNTLLCELSGNSNTVILTETTSNLYCEDFIDTIDNVVSAIPAEDAELFKPDILISFGGQVVSKMIKKFLRNNKPENHWHISPSGESMDSYFSLTEAVIFNITDFLSLLEIHSSSTTSMYSEIWKLKRESVDKRKKQFLSKVEYSDLKVFETILNIIPSDSVLHLGNSTPVRYSQLFGSDPTIEYNSNRGVSGIDGQISTYVGYSFGSDNLNILITGDLGFLYDSNGLMNHYLKPNLKIIVINNQGGGIFRFIPGPDTTPNLEEFFEAKHQWDSKYICKAFGVEYLKAENIVQVKDALPKFLKSENGPALLEIFTPSDKNGIILREYFKFIRVGKKD